MEFKYIALTMVIILICLFTFTPFFAKKEKLLSQLEAHYMEDLQNFKNGLTTKDAVLESGQLLAKGRGLNVATGLSMVENDLDAFSNSED